MRRLQRMESRGVRRPAPQRPDQSGGGLEIRGASRLRGGTRRGREHEKNTMMEVRPGNERNAAARRSAMLLLAFLLESAGCNVRSSTGGSNGDTPPPGG